MKSMKKFASILLALVMAMALTVPAFAAEGDKTITIKNTNPGHKYGAYQIFTGDVVNEETDEETKAPVAGTAILSNVRWGTNIDEAGAKAIAKALMGTAYSETTGKITIGTAPNTREVDAYSKDGAQAVAYAMAKDYENNGAALADEINSHISGNPTEFTENTTTDSEGKTTTTNYTTSVAPGYYLIKDTEQVTGNDTATDFILEVVGAAEVTPKSGTVEVDKKIVENGSKVEVNNAAIGDTVNYEITGTLPANYEAFKFYYYEFSDTLSKGLSFENDVKVMMGDTDVTSWFTVTPDEKTNGENATSISIKCENLKSHEADGIKASANSTFVVTYTAKLTKAAEIGTVAGNPNSVQLIYSNDPNKSGNGSGTPGSSDNPTGKTPEKTVITYTTELEITKIDGATKEILPGAEFTLTGTALNVVLVKEEVYTESATGTYWKLKDGTYTTDDPNAEGMDQTLYENVNVKYAMTIEDKLMGTDQDQAVVKAFVDAKGVVTFIGLKAGTYTLKESETPAGYNTISDIEFTIAFEQVVNPDGSPVVGSDGKPSYNFKITQGDGFDVTDGKISTSIENNRGAQMPETGGIGTTIFYTVGGLLVVAAGIMLVTKRRMQAQA